MKVRIQFKEIEKIYLLKRIFSNCINKHVRNKYKNANSNLEIIYFQNKR